MSNHSPTAIPDSTIDEMQDPELRARVRAFNDAIVRLREPAVDGLLFRTPSNEVPLSVAFPGDPLWRLIYGISEQGRQMMESSPVVLSNVVLAEADRVRVFRFGGQVADAVNTVFSVEATDTVAPLADLLEGSAGQNEVRVRSPQEEGDPVELILFGEFLASLPTA